MAPPHEARRPLQGRHAAGAGPVPARGPGPQRPAAPQPHQEPHREERSRPAAEPERGLWRRDQEARPWEPASPRPGGPAAAEDQVPGASTVCTGGQGAVRPPVSAGQNCTLEQQAGQQTHEQDGVRRVTEPGPGPGLWSRPAPVDGRGAKPLRTILDDFYLFIHFSPGEVFVCMTDGLSVSMMHSQQSWRIQTPQVSRLSRVSRVSRVHKMIDSCMSITNSSDTTTFKRGEI